MGISAPHTLYQQHCSRKCIWEACSGSVDATIAKTLHKSLYPEQKAL